MKAVAWHDVGEISVDEVPSPAIREPADAIVRITLVHLGFDVGVVGCHGRVGRTDG